MMFRTTHQLCLLLVILGFSGTSRGNTIIDLSHVLSRETKCWPGSKTGFEYSYEARGIGAGGFWFSAGQFCTPEHCGTHVDAPIHVAAGGWTVDKIPAHHLVGSGSIIDVSGKVGGNPDYQLGVQDLVDWETEHGSIDGTIVMINFGWSQYYTRNRTYYLTGPNGSLGLHGNDTSNLHFPGIHKDAAKWIVENRPSVYGVGVDTTSLDYGPSRDFMAHQTLFARNIYGIENLRNLDKLPARGAQLMILPIPVANGTGAPARVLARVLETADYTIHKVASVSFVFLVVIVTIIARSKVKQS